MNQEKVKQVNRELRRIVREGSQLSFNELRIIVALERAVARLESNPELANHLIFKGGFVLLKNFGSPRFTRDADALAVEISEEKLTPLIETSLSQDIEDGFWFGDIQMHELEKAFRFSNWNS